MGMNRFTSLIMLLILMKRVKHALVKRFDTTRFQYLLPDLSANLGANLHF